MNAATTAGQCTFTKWITTAPHMAGVVGGAVGNGAYAGEVLMLTPGTTTVIEALYHLRGSKHSFSALVHVEQTGVKGAISGVVTDGWMKGRQVAGEFTQVTTPRAPGDGNAYQGTVSIMGAP